jgi:hypothetical protein
MACMKCPEKEDLQHNCTARWNDYIAAINESSLSVDPSSGTIKPPSISELVAIGLEAARPGQAVSGIDPTKGIPWPYAAAVRLRGEHLRASMALSNHLITTPLLN